MNEKDECDGEQNDITEENYVSESVCVMCVCVCVCVCACVFTCMSLNVENFEIEIFRMGLII